MRYYGHIITGADENTIGFRLTKWLEVEGDIIKIVMMSQSHTIDYMIVTILYQKKVLYSFRKFCRNLFSRRKFQG